MELLKVKVIEVEWWSPESRMVEGRQENGGQRVQSFSYMGGISFNKFL
jgi:hypothetical protein